MGIKNKIKINIKTSKGNIIKSIFEKLRKFTITKLKVILIKKIMELDKLLIYAPRSSFLLDKYERYNNIIPKIYKIVTTIKEAIFNCFYSNLVYKYEIFCLILKLLLKEEIKN